MDMATENLTSTYYANNGNKSVEQKARKKALKH